jgi:signal transduction histidine kinase
LHLLTVTLLVLSLAFIESNLSVSRDVAAFLVVIAFVAIYQVMYGLVRNITRYMFVRSKAQPGIEIAIGALTQTLDTSTLISSLAQGVDHQFGQPVFAIYKGDIYGSNTLTLAVQQRMPDAPQILQSGVLTDAMTRLPVIDARELHKQLEQHLTLDEQQMITHPAIALWCPIVHSRGYLLGLMVLGMRGDFDPYRETDRQQVQRMLNAAALALANSAALAQQRESEEIIRGLYQRILQAHDLAARNIAAELHADVINGAALFNLYDLEDILNDITDQSLKSRISKVIDGERTLMDALRGICEQLHPTGIDDPLGLPGAIRTLLEKVERSSGWHCRFQTYGTALELSSVIQYEALRTIREAVNNAVKHAQATSITVNLRYPSTPRDIMTLEIVDDGQGDVSITPKPGHWGVRTIQESARLIHGVVDFITEQGKGTCVRLTFPATYCPVEHSEGELYTTSERPSGNVPTAASINTHVTNHRSTSNTTLTSGA